MVIWDTKVLKLTQTLDEMPGFVRVSLDWAGQPLEVASVYAPSESGVNRIDFFNKIERSLTPHTWAGGDWNCVPDVTVDAKARTLWVIVTEARMPSER